MSSASIGVLRRLAQTPLQRTPQRGVPTIAKKAAPEFFFPERLQIIEPELLWPRRRRSFLWLLLSVLWLRWAPFGCSRRSTSWWWPGRLTIGALRSFSRAARFTRRCASGWRRDWLANRRLRSLFWAAPLIRIRACWRRRAESLTLGSSTATLRRNILRTTRTRTWTFAQLARRWR